MWYAILFTLVLLEGIDGPVTSQFTSPEPALGGLLVNVGSEEVGTQPRAKVRAIHAVKYKYHNYYYNYFLV